MKIDLRRSDSSNWTGEEGGAQREFWLGVDSDGGAGAGGLLFFFDFFQSSKTVISVKTHSITWLNQRF